MNTSAPNIESIIRDMDNAITFCSGYHLTPSEIALVRTALAASQPSQPVEAGEPIYQTATHVSNGIVWADVTKEMYEAPFKFEKRIVYAAPQPAQTAQSETTALEACRAIVKWCNENPPAGDALWCVQLARRAVEARSAQIAQAGEPTYVSSQATSCAKCGEHKHTPLRIDWMGGYVCLTCIDQELEAHDPAVVLDDERASKDAVTREQIEAWAKLSGIPLMFEKHIEQLGDFAIFARQARAAATQSTATLPPMPDPTELLDIARVTGLRSYLHGVNAPNAREILEAYQLAVDERRTTLPAGTPEQSTTTQQAQPDRALTDSVRYQRFRRWHPRLQTSYWTGQWWEPIYGEKMDACVDSLDEVPQPTSHADQKAAAQPASGGDRG